MDVIIHPTCPRGRIKAIPSKSFLHRALICAALCQGRSVIRNIVYSDDILATLNALRKIGVKTIQYNNHLIINGIDVKNTKIDTVTIDANQSGSTLRFFIPILGLIADNATIIGKESLFTRPLDEYEKLFKEQGLTFEKDKSFISIKGSIKACHYEISSEKSSQFISGLLFALPLLEGDSTIRITGKKSSFSYVMMTINVLRDFGINVEITDDIVIIKGGQKFTPTHYTIEGDYSMAALYLAMGTLNGRIQVNGLKHDSIQGDQAIVDILTSANGNISYIKNSFVALKSQISSINCSLTDCVDLGPILFVLALFATNPSVFKDVSALRYKESDRLNCMLTELRRLGAKILFDDVANTVTVIPQKYYQLNEGLDTYNDHRLAMAFTLLAVKLDKSLVIRGFDATNKSYPHIIDDLISLGFRIDII